MMFACIIALLFLSALAPAELIAKSSEGSLKRILRLCVLSTLLAGIFSHAVLAQDADGYSARFYVEKSSMHVGERVEGTIEITWDGEKWEPMGFEQPEKLGVFDVLYWEVSRQEINPSGRLERTVNFEATTFEMGEQPLGPYSVSLRSLTETSAPALPGETLGTTVVKADSVRLDVKSLLASIEEKSGETLELASPIKAPLQLAPDYGWLWWVVGGFLGALFLAAVLAYAIWRFVRRGVMAPARPAPPPLPPAEEALAALKELEAKGAVQNMPARIYYNKLSYILRRYLERRHRFEALEMTSGEILDVVRQVAWSPDLFETLRAEMTESDAAKYARYEPPLERRQVSLESVREIIERTRPSATLASKADDSAEAVPAPDENAGGSESHA